MRFRRYATNTATLKEWSRQLGVVNKGVYPLYDSDENTLYHWKDKLNQEIGINTFRIYGTPDDTICNWQDRLNGIYNG